MKYRKRIISVILSFLLIVSMTTACDGCSAEQTADFEESLIAAQDIPELWKAELRCADALGFPVDLMEQDTVTGRELCALLDALVGYAAPDRLGQWQMMYPQLRINSLPMSRIDVLASVFLAVQFVGGEYTDYVISVDTVDQNLAGKAAAEWDNISFELFGGIEEVGFFDLNEFGEDHLAVACSYYNIASRCLVDGEYPITFDEAADSFRLADRATGLEALMAVIRPLVSAHPELFDSAPDADTLALLSDAQARREYILNTESGWTTGEGGTVYYVSPGGDDSNDGLTPETAWRSLDKVNSATIRSHGYLGSDQDIIEQLDTKEFPAYAWAVQHSGEWAELKEGDVVLFERGGVWRGQFIGAEGVTYSAYGEGTKPEILGSPENGSGAEKWTLLEGTDNIWVFYRELQECGGILLDGETVAIKETPFWDTDTQRWLDGENLTETATAMLDECWEFDVRSIDNLHFFNELKEVDRYAVYACWGKLYLRCDEGNPGEVYESIEFFTSSDGWGLGASAPANGTLDNLCFRYLSTGLGVNPNSTVRNCVVEWVGGIVQNYAKQENGSCVVTRCGDGIAAGSMNATAVNNYVAHCYDMGITVESFYDTWLNEPDRRCRNVSVSGNLIESCGGGCLVAAWDAFDQGLEAPLFEHIAIDDNYILYSGQGWSHRGDYLLGHSYLSSVIVNLNPGNSGISVTDNVLYDCWDIGALVNYQYYSGDDSAADFEGNTYVLNEGACAVDFRKIDSEGYEERILADGALAERISLGLGDDTAVIHLFDRVFQNEKENE